MAHVTFKGGVYPHKRKRFTREKTLEEYLPKGDLVYPLLQHIGGMAVPVVEPGERVLEGQLIARASGDISAPVHASVSGIVRSIEPRLTVSGKMIPSIVVENDGAYEKYPAEEIGPWKELEPGERLRRIRDAGVVGMGGAGFPTHVKLAVRNPKRIRYVIVNGTECEPYMTGDYRRMVEEPEHLVEGLEIVLGFFERAVGILALEDNKRDAITALQLAVREEPRMEVRVFETKYPQGAERMLIYSVSGMEIDSTQLPADAGCIVLNVETVCAIRQALVEGRPLILGGVEIPYDLGLLGHSDADVALHALMDALLGAAALGDIGKLFPDSDERWRGADSRALLRMVAVRLRGAGYMVGNVDVTILAQRPKLAPYIQRMRENIAVDLDMPVDQVSVKATTEEGLGFTGRGEGIAAHGLALLVPLESGNDG